MRASGMEKDFDRWNRRKKALDASGERRRFFYYEREIWWCSMGVNIGVEMDGKHHRFERPILILRKFNKDMFWGVPLTSKERVGNFYQKVAHASGASWAILSQLRTWSSKRLIRKLGIADFGDFRRIREKIRGFM